MPRHPMSRYPRSHRYLLTLGAAVGAIIVGAIIVLNTHRGGRLKSRLDEPESKYWNDPAGWREIVAFLRDAGYRVICVDQKATHGTGIVWNHIPHGAEDETGDKPLAERTRYLKHAAFFVDLSSGLSWLGWAVGTPVLMISGFTHPTNEFATPYRVINFHACNGCWNDVRHRFDHKDFLWCPRHKDTPRQFECTRLITVDQVKAAIRRIPDFGRTAARPKYVGRAHS